MWPTFPSCHVAADHLEKERDYEALASSANHRTQVSLSCQNRAKRSTLLTLFLCNASSEEITPCRKVSTENSCSQGRNVAVVCFGEKHDWAVINLNSCLFLCNDRTVIQSAAWSAEWEVQDSRGQRWFSSQCHTNCRTKIYYQQSCNQ